MDSITADRLIELNRQFYQTFAGPFSKTRQRLQPGVQRMMEAISPEMKILDLGCGNGELWRNLKIRGHHGSYIGIDFSLELLRDAAASDPGASLLDLVAEDRPPEALDCMPACFVRADLAGLEWDRLFHTETFDLVLSFAVLHHLPGSSLRSRLISKARRLLSPGGSFIFSVWQFLKHPRFRSRIQPWENVGLSSEKVDPGDYLLDWRQGGYGLRYVHHFEESELNELAKNTNFQVSECFFSDGDGGRLSLYQVWRKEG